MCAGIPIRGSWPYMIWTSCLDLARVASFEYAYLIRPWWCRVEVQSLKFLTRRLSMYWILLLTTVVPWGTIVKAIWGCHRPSFLTAQYAFDVCPEECHVLVPFLYPAAIPLCATYCKHLLCILGLSVKCSGGGLSILCSVVECLSVSGLSTPRVISSA